MKSEDITKLGQSLIIYNKVIGACLRQVSDDVFMISMSNGGVSWKEEVHIDDIEIGGEFKQVKKENEVYEKEDEGCEGGACKL